MVLAILGPLNFHMNSSISLVTSARRSGGNLQINLECITIFTITCLLCINAIAFLYIFLIFFQQCLVDFKVHIFCVLGWIEACTWEKNKKTKNPGMERTFAAKSQQQRDS